MLALAVNVPPAPRLPPRFKIPAPVNVKSAFAAVPVKDIFPVQFTVPVDTVT